MSEFDSRSTWRFLERLDLSGVHYVSWKNNHELDLALGGGSDLDIFVPLEEKSLFLHCCYQNNWVRVLSPFANHACIEHYISVNPNGQIFHLHVYFKVVTGETLLKEFELPLDGWLIDNRIREPGYGVWVLSDSVQAYMFVARHLLKGAGIFSRALYRREYESYAAEWELCRLSFDCRASGDPLQLERFALGSGVMDTTLTLPKRTTALLFRANLIAFMRHSYLLLHARSAIYLIAAGLNKFILKRKKLLPEYGLIFAFSGVDGAGKSTMLGEVESVLDGVLSVRTDHIGKPQGAVGDLVWTRSFGRKVKQSFTSDIETQKGSSLSVAIKGVILAILRLRKATQISALAKRGHLVLVDRWPTDQVGKMDGPRIVADGGCAKIIRLCKRIEVWAYRKMPRADVCFFFQVPVDIARERNRLRSKSNKETDEQIIDRHRENSEFKPLARKTVLLDNSDELVACRRRLIEAVWHEIASRY